VRPDRLELDDPVHRVEPHDRRARHRPVRRLDQDVQVTAIRRRPPDALVAVDRVVVDQVRASGGDRCASTCMSSTASAVTSPKLAMPHHCSRARLDPRTVSGRAAGNDRDGPHHRVVVFAVVRSATHVVPGVDGEPIRVEDFGAPGGRPVLVHAGSPGSRRLFGPDAELAAGQFGLRLLSYDRPGYSGRPPRAGRRIVDAIADVRCVADALGIERLGMWGLSGGGCYALACAALLPDLVTGAAVFACFAPYGSPGLDFCGDWPPEYRREVDLFRTDRAAARENWRQDAERLFATCATPAGWLARWGDAAGTDDAHSREVADHLAAVLRDCLTDGDDGWWDDWAAVLTPWGCDLTAIRVPVRLWHGGRDRAVPVTNGHWLAAHVPGIVAHFPATHDHTNVEHDNRAAAYAWLSGLA
jgi:pimeloyl-ACP methyl ester carboxylesterase